MIRKASYKPTMLLTDGCAMAMYAHSRRAGWNLAHILYIFALFLPKMGINVAAHTCTDYMLGIVV